MKAMYMLLIGVLIGSSFARASTATTARLEAEYYVRAYAEHYGVPTVFVRAIVEQESQWNSCAISTKGAVGLMQLMPVTAMRLGVRNRCDINQSVSGAVRLLAWLERKFRGDLRLVAAAYYAGAVRVERRGLSYANPGVVAYVASIRERVALQQRSRNFCADRISDRRTR